MAGIEDILPTSVSSYFWGNAPAGSPVSYQGLQTRRKIVESMLAGKRPYPKTIGEGIASIGEALGGSLALRQLDEADAAQLAASQQRIGGVAPSDYTGATPPVSAPPPPATAAPAVRTSDATDATSPDMAPAPALAYADASGNPAATPAPIDITPDSAVGVGSATPGIPIPPPRPVYDRSRQNAEIQADPALATRMRLMAAGEVGSNPALQQIQIESALNRAITQGVPVSQALKTYTGPDSGGYYPPETFLRGQAGQDPLTAAMRGSDLGGQTLGFSPTGNASGGVASRGIASGRYGDARAIGTGPGAETYVTQDSPTHLARLAATRVPQNFPDSTPVAAADQTDTGDGSALAFSGQPVSGQDAITQALMQAQQRQQGPVPNQPGPDAVALPSDALSGNVSPGVLPFSGTSPAPVQMAAAANGNPPIPTSIPPAPTPAQPLPTDLYKPPERVLPTAPPLRPILAREAAGYQMMQEGLLTGNQPLAAMGQQIAAQEKAARDELYKQDMEKYSKDYANTLALKTLDEQKRYSAPADAAALRKAIYEGPPQAVPPGLGSAGPPIASAPGQTPPTQLALAGAGVPPGRTALPPNYNPLLGTNNSPFRTGIPTKDANPGIPEAAWDKQQEPILLKNVEAAKNAPQQFNEMIDLIHQAINNPEVKYGVGPLSSLARSPQGPAAGFGKLMEQIQGKNFLSGIANIKDTGGSSRFTQLEAEKTAQAQGRIAPEQSKEDWLKAMTDFEDHIRDTMAAVQRRANYPVTAYQVKGDPSTLYAPDLGQIGTRTVNGVPTPQRYIGGNPRRPSSYEPVGQ